MSDTNNINNKNTNTIILEAPKGCDYVDLKDYLVYSRKDNDNFIYEINKIKSVDTESECEKAWSNLENKQIFRSLLIKNCIQQTKNEIESLNNNNNNDNQSEKRKLNNKLNMLNMEIEVESILLEAAKKVFHKVCK